MASVGNKREIGRCPGILVKKGINLEIIATEGFFADFTSTGLFEHHTKNVSKSTFEKFLKMVVLKHRVSHLHVFAEVFFLQRESYDLPEFHR